PRNEHVGAHTVALEVRDRAGERAQQQFSLRVENTNDAPSFTSKPDTVAFVDSMYVYKPLVQDVDSGDRVALAVLSAPAWLLWEAANQTLRGTPKFTDMGTTQISLRAEDLSKAAAVQNVNVRVVDLAAPDNTAPASPQSLAIAPAAWSATPQFTLRWQNPFDPSKIAGAYYKIGAQPNSARDGTLVRASANEPIREIQLQAASEGRTPVYVWLMDGRNNVDHKTASRVDYYFDRTPPLAPSGLRVLTTNNGNWIAGDTINFVWQPATDALSGVASYTFNVDEKVVAQLPGAATNFVFVLALKEATHTYQVVANDSAGNRRASARENFRVDHTPPRLTHTVVDTITLGQPLTLRAQANDAASGVERVRVRYRNAGTRLFREAVMSFASGEFITSIAAAELNSVGFEYVLSASDSAGNVAHSIATVHAAVVRSDQIAAPNATRGEYYQLVSVPYAMTPDTSLVWLQEDFGAYDQTAWRLYSYHTTEGNVEFGDSGFTPFAPGHALWLITAQPKSFDLGPAHSISTAQDFVLELQPGWNLIATPFDFLTDWSAVHKPALVEAQLWAFDGKQYLRSNDIMQPWQGYFVRNLYSAPEKISIPPHVAQASLPASDLSSNKSSFEKSMTTTARAANDPSHWRIQLHVTNGAFADHENWLGVSSLAQEEWDELEWSEPPLAPGNFVALRFNQTSWQRFNGAFATDFRPPSARAQCWRFEVLSAQEGQRVELVLERSGFIAREKLFVLVDAASGLAREIKFDERTNLSTALTWRSTKTPQRFAFYAGMQEQLEEQNMTALLTPKQFELAPAYPNPARAQTGQEAMSTFRFSLPQAGTIDLRIYDMLGRQVRGLVLKQLYALGHHEIIWDGKDDRGNAAAAGVYLYRMTAPNFHATRKMIVLKE
ncbi:MAG: FlgD immunoglobulin-like domain containing protein, partial [candidate division KSB1 bacterium]